MRTIEFCNFNFNLFGYRRCRIGSPSGLLRHAGWSLLFYAPFPLESHSLFSPYMLISQGNTPSDLSDFISNSIIFLFHCIQPTFEYMHRFFSPNRTTTFSLVMPILFPTLSCIFYLLWAFSLFQLINISNMLMENLSHICLVVRA